jgi:hypothetical protein
MLGKGREIMNDESFLPPFLKTIYEINYLI